MADSKKKQSMASEHRPMCTPRETYGNSAFRYKLWVEGATVFFMVIKQLENIRGKVDFMASNRIRVKSTSFPQLQDDTNTVYIRGNCKEDDHNIVSAGLDTPEKALEFFEDIQKALKEWISVGCPTGILRSTKQPKDTSPLVVPKDEPKIKSKPKSKAKSDMVWEHEQPSAPFKFKVWIEATTVYVHIEEQPAYTLGRVNFTAKDGTMVVSDNVPELEEGSPRYVYIKGKTHNSGLNERTSSIKLPSIAEAHTFTTSIVGALREWTAVGCPIAAKYTPRPIEAEKPAAPEGGKPSKKFYYKLWRGDDEVHFQVLHQDESLRCMVNFTATNDVRIRSVNYPHIEDHGAKPIIFIRGRCTEVDNNVTSFDFFERERCVKAYNEMHEALTEWVDKGCPTTDDTSDKKEVVATDIKPSSAKADADHIAKAVEWLKKEELAANERLRAIHGALASLSVF